MRTRRSFLVSLRSFGWFAGLAASVVGCNIPDAIPPAGDAEARTTIIPGAPKDAGTDGAKSGGGSGPVLAQEDGRRFFEPTIVGDRVVFLSVPVTSEGGPGLDAKIESVRMDGSDPKTIDDHQSPDALFTDGTVILWGMLDTTVDAGGSLAWAVYAAPPDGSAKSAKVATWTGRAWLSAVDGTSLYVRRQDAVDGGPTLESIDAVPRVDGGVNRLATLAVDEQITSIQLGAATDPLFVLVHGLSGSAYIATVARAGAAGGSDAAAPADGGDAGDSSEAGASALTLLGQPFAGIGSGFVVDSQRVYTVTTTGLDTPIVALSRDDGGVTPFVTQLGAAPGMLGQDDASLYFTLGAPGPVIARVAKGAAAGKPVVVYDPAEAGTPVAASDAGSDAAGEAGAPSEAGSVTDAGGVDATLPSDAGDAGSPVDASAPVAQVTGYAVGATAVFVTTTAGMLIAVSK